MRIRCLGSGTVARFVIAVGLLWPLGAARVSAEMLLFYDFNTVTNDDTVIDTSGKGNHGQQFGTEFTNPGLGHTGAANDRALDFLGALDAAFLDVTLPFSMFRQPSKVRSSRSPTTTPPPLPCGCMAPTSNRSMEPQFGLRVTRAAVKWWCTCPGVMA